MATLEQWFADQLAALQSGGADVFKTAAVWRHQVGPTKAGLEAFIRYEPFAFVGFVSTDSAREGDNDLRQVLEFAILIGVKSRSDGVARTGNSRNLGTSKIRDLVIALFDRLHPGEGFECDEVYYTSDSEVIDAPKLHAIEMRFETSYVSQTN